MRESSMPIEKSLVLTLAFEEFEGRYRQEFDVFYEYLIRGLGQWPERRLSRRQ